ncbi:hypothetical protein V6N11_044027 [Hibiscus sabdariffa]|uniref:Uncharacterized protein n=1 Tax=Hibiscus sabdariffa TaxID=183260 RepID=A0ABR2RDY9_9ROSI
MWKGSAGPLAENLLVRTLWVNNAIMVSDMVDEFGQWKWHLFDQMVPVSVLLQIAAIKPLFESRVTDQICGGATTNKRFSDLDHIFRQCAVSHSTWIPLIHYNKVDEFFALDFKQWIFVNLSNIGGFARDQVHQDVLFGSMLWNLWRKRNEWIFDTHVWSGESVLQYSMRMKQEAVVARPSMPSGCIYGGSDAGVQVRWVKPPRG